MNRDLSKALAVVRRSIEESGDGLVSVSVRLPRLTAEKLRRLLEVENSGGALVIGGRDEFSPAEASVLLGVSRPTVMGRIADGSLQADKVGSRWVITAAAVLAFQQLGDASRAETERRVAALAAGVGLPPAPPAKDSTG